MKKSIIILFFLLFSGCAIIPAKNSTFEKQKKEIATLQTQQQHLIQEKKDLEQKYNDLIKNKQDQVQNSESNRISVGGAQAIAVLGTLNAEPNKTKYTEAGIKGLGVTKNAIKDFVTTKDLLEAIETQNNLISEQATQIAEGNKKINELNKEIDNKKENEIKLLSDIEKLEEQKIKEVGAKLIEISKKDDVIKKKEVDIKEKEEKLNAINELKAAEFDKSNKWYVKLNPFTHLSKFFSSIFIWIIIFVVLGLILKICSIIFPGVNVLQIIVKGIGSIIGGILKMIFGVIPGLFSGLGAVDKKIYEQEKKIADNSIGAIQELKYENPTLYSESIRPKLQEWNQNDKQLDSAIEQKLKDLNLK